MEKGNKLNNKQHIKRKWIKRRDKKDIKLKHKENQKKNNKKFK